MKGKNGLEIGGPSRVFNDTLKIYERIAGLDGVNFAGRTVWEGAIKSGKTYNYVGDRTGHQFISDATDLRAIADARYEFLLSSNCLEHVANPLKAVVEWKRVIRVGAPIILVLPNHKSNFDRHRPVTRLEHLLDDFENDVNEHDLTHLEEIVALHDLSLDPLAGSVENFGCRSLDNFNNRTLHHHIFSITLMKEMLDFAGFDVLKTSNTFFDLFALAVKRA